MKRMIIGTLLFICTTFLIQACSHFVINVVHYSKIPHMRPTEGVIFPLALLTMTLQGSVLSYIYGIFSKEAPNWKNGLTYAFLMCLFFVSYTAFTEAGKYQVPDVLSWILVEGTAGLIQFCLFGILLGAAFKKVK